MSQVGRPAVYLHMGSKSLSKLSRTRLSSWTGALLALLALSSANACTGDLVSDRGIKLDASGSRVDANGNRVDANGNRVDANGNRVDEDGNRVDEDGNPIPGTGIDPTGPSTASNCVPGTVDAGYAGQRRLSHEQYNNVSRDLLGVTTQPANKFPAEEAGGIIGGDDARTVSVLLAENYETASRESAVAMTANIQGLTGCSQSNTAQDLTCATQFVRDFGFKSYRRSLSQTEVDDLLSFYNLGREESGTFAHGIEMVIRRILQSPHFLYRIEFGSQPQATGELVALTDYEMATRISFFFSNSNPDDALLAEAKAGRLSTKEEIRAQASRLIATQKGEEAVVRFFSRWMALEAVVTVDKSDPQWTEATGVAMAAEARAFVKAVMFGSGDASFESLLTAPIGFINQDNAWVYGKNASGSEMQRVDFEPAERSGVLTLPSVLAINSYNDSPNPIERGKFIRELLLCSPLAPPPPGLVVVVPPAEPGLSGRERFIAHSIDPECAGCHKLTDPLGFGFENYDAVGQYRTEDNDEPVDASGEVFATQDIDGKFVGAVELGQKLAGSQQVKDCVVETWFRHAMGRVQATEDACSHEEVSKEFTPATSSMLDLALAITQTDTFRLKKVR